MMRSWFQKRRRGAMAMAAVIGLLPVTSMFAANMNASQMVEDRRESQDAADALAKMHGAWSARALNVISMNNVTSAQLLTVAVGSDALDATLIELGIFAFFQGVSIGGHAGDHCSLDTGSAILDGIWAGICFPQHALAAIPALNAGFKISDIYRDFDPIHGSKVAEKSLAAIEGMNRALIERHPRAMREIGEDYAEHLSINAFHFVDPCDSPDARNCRPTNTSDGMALPLDEGGTTESLEMCAAMRFGFTGVHTTFRQRGFEIAKGPISAGGSTQNPNVKDHINHITDIGLTLQDYDRFYKSGLSDLLRSPLEGPGDSLFPQDMYADPIGSYAIPNFYSTFLRIYRFFPLFTFDENPSLLRYPLDQERDGHNAFKRWFETKFSSVCVGRSDVPIFGLRAEVPTLWKMRDVTIADRVTARWPEQMPDPFHILTFTANEPLPRKTEVIQHLTSKVTPPDTSIHFGYGQVGIYNPEGPTLYTQAWRARLMAATRADDVSTTASDLDRQATSNFDDLASILRAVSSQSTWGRIHAH